MEKIDKAINYLKEYNHLTADINLEKLDILRVLMNITMPINLSDEYYQIQDEILKDELSKKHITDINTLNPFCKNLYLWKCDITTIKADAIVNACNSQLLGCFEPLHACIDNAIHSYAGLQVRRDCLNIMEKQGHDEMNGAVKVTKGYNLPSKYIFHTVGPICNGYVSNQNIIDLKNCYLSCLNKAIEMRLESLVFCSISTGIYSFPIKEASKLAIKLVIDYLEKNNNNIKVVFNVFSEEDYLIYERELSRYKENP